MQRKITFRWKLYITYSFIISFVLAVSLYGFYRYNAGLLEKNMEKASLDMLQVSRERLTDFLTNMDQQLRFFQTLPEFVESVEKLHAQEATENYFVDHPGEAKKIQQMFISILATEADDSSISYVDKDYNNIHASVSGGYEKSISNKKLQDNIDFSALDSSGEYYAYIFPHEDYWSHKEKHVVSVYRPVKDMFQEYGVLIYDKNIEELGTVLGPGSDEIMLLDRNTGKVYSTRTGAGAALEEEISELLMTNKEEGFLKTVGSYNYYYSDFPGADWALILKKDVGFYIQEKYSLACVIAVIFVLGTLFMLFLTYFVSRNLLSPLRLMKEKLEKQKLNETVSLEVYSDNDEIIMLSHTIENILNQINVQNQTLIAAKDLAMKAHMSAMEAQMSPHFLYNSLAVIGTYGLEKGDMVIPQMCNELSSLLRYSIDYNNKEVRLADEIGNIKSYLYIMKMRYEHMLEYSWDLDSSIEDVRVPKLILQPIVENCFQHGFKSIPPVWEIKVRSWQTEGKWFISIANTGTSLDDRKMQRLYDALKKFETSPVNEVSIGGDADGKGLGLKNTVMRLHICYQGLESFRIYTLDGFTMVEIGGVIRET